MDEKYFWLKLKRDFFKRHDIQIIESMSNGKEYALFYLKLLCESIDHNGELRFSDTIPYNETMLSTITNTNIDIVRTAIKVLVELELIEILDNGTLYMTEINKMVGSETYWAERKRIQRSDIKELPIGQCPTSPGKNKIKSKSKSKSNIEIYNIEKPNLEEIESYIKEKNLKVNGKEFYNYFETGNWVDSKGNKVKNWKQKLLTWNSYKKDEKKTPINNCTKRDYANLNNLYSN